MIRIRRGTDDDAAGIIKLIGGVFEEYEGCVLDLDGVDADLLQPASNLDRLWVLDRNGTVIGSGACSFKGGFVELKKMYIEKQHRGFGYGRKLVALVEEAAIESGIDRIELWSDTRFVGAHAMYAHFGYIQSDRTRQLHDPSNTTEFHFTKDL